MPEQPTLTDGNSVLRNANAEGGKPRIEIVPLDKNVLEPAVSIYLDAFKENISGKVGRAYPRRFLRWFAEADIGIALAAMAKGEVVGFVVGAPIGYQKRLNRDLFWVVLWSLLVRPWALFSGNMLGSLWGRLQVALGIKSELKPSSNSKQEPARDNVQGNDSVNRYCLEKCMSLVGIGVSLKARGLGVGSALMARFEEQAREAGMRSLRLSVFTDNEAAIAAYKKAGWSEQPATRADQFYFWKFLK
jgi:ribosomal protein S18 acetylase RimI-like enzyme